MSQHWSELKPRKRLLPVSRWLALWRFRREQAIKRKVIHSRHHSMHRLRQGGSIQFLKK